MPPSPTGHVVPRAGGGRDLVLVRTPAVPRDEAWSAFSRPEVAGRWFATWTGDPRPGTTIRISLTGEEGAESDVSVEACDPPGHLAVTAVDDHGSWRLEATLEEEAGGTRITFVHHLDAGAAVGEIGPGWEYYLDRLVSVLLDTPDPDFDDYFPAQQAYYEGL